MKITILTLFPEVFLGPFQESIIKHAQQKGIVEITYLNIRNFGIGSHKTVDDTLFGGGTGMLMRVDVLHEAIMDALDPNISREKQRVIYMGAHGRQFVQSKAKEFTSYDHLILICGHYEGIDERAKKYIDEELSVGDFILTGGEIPAMLVTDAVIRLLPGVLKEGVTDKESFSLTSKNLERLLEHPHYTKPRVYDGMSVPDVLISGDHKKIQEWQIQESVVITKHKRPDLIKTEK